MTDFKGSKFELAGFNIRQKGTLVDAFAIFCGVGGQVEPGSHIHAIQEVELKQRHDAARQAAVVAERPNGRTLGELVATALNGTYPVSSGPEAWVSANDIFEALIGKQDLAHTDGDELRLPVLGIKEVLADIGPEKMALLLTEMGKAKKAYLQGVNTFIPAAKLDLI